MKQKYFITVLLSLVALVAGAQIATGQWKTHPYFVGKNATSCIDAGNKVYYLAGGSLFCYDKSAGTNDVLDIDGVLNDINITKLYHNPAKNIVVITYENCNIDIIDADGKVVNVSAIKDVIPNRTKTINDVTFTSSKIYIATSFGYVTLSLDDYRVIEGRDYDAIIPSVAVVGDIKVFPLLKNTFYYCKESEPVETYNRHKTAENTAGNDGTIFPINDSKFFFTTSDALYVGNINRSTDETGDYTCTFDLNKVVDAKPTNLQRTPSGFVASFVSNNYYCTFDAEGNLLQQLAGNEVYSSQEQGNWWTVGANGLSHIVNGVRGDYITPNGISIEVRAYWTTYDPSQQRILLSRTTDNRVISHYYGYYAPEVNSYDGNTWRDISPTGGIYSYGGNYWPVVSPNEPDTYFFSYRSSGGVAKVQNNNIVLTYNNNNSPLMDRAVALRFDSKGNLWMPQTRDQTGHIDVVAISAQNQALTSVTPSMFVINDLNGACYAEGFKRMTFDIGKNDTKVFSAGDYNSPLVVWNNNDDLSVNKYKKLTSFIDQNNKNFSTYAWVYLKADRDSMIWAGTESGLIAFDPTQAFNDDFRINRVEVKIDEGVATSGNLLEGTQVNCIDVDSQNRKWIGTNTAGVYFVSADGSEIYKHFDSSNSPIPNDQIYSVCYNEATGSVLIVTGKGVVEYFSDITPSASDYSNTYAYPNPVHPDYTGYITIKGLMNNSNVVITNSKGTVVATLQSTGGVALWNGCTASGNRLPTGTYKVYAAQGSTPATTGTPVARIIMIK